MIGGAVKGCEYSHRADEIKLAACVQKYGKVHVICECPQNGELAEPAEGASLEN